MSKDCIGFSRMIQFAAFFSSIPLNIQLNREL
jgi:hypothetical protein